MYKYNRTNWQNSPSKSTPINATRLNNIEIGVTTVATFTNDATYNMLNYPFDDGRTLVNGITITENDGKITFNGTCTGDFNYLLTKGRRLIAGEYVISGCISTGGDNYNIVVYDTENSEVIGSDEGATDNFTVYTDTTVDIYIAIASGATLSNTDIFTPCLTKGNNRDYYKPFAKGDTFADAIEWYVDDAKAENCIPYPYYEKTKTVAGITWTVNSDGTITANGTTGSSASNFYCLNRSQNIKVDSGVYTLSGTPSNVDGCYMWGNYYNSAGRLITTPNDNGEGALVTIEDGTGPIGIYCTIKKNTTVNNVVFKPMLENSDTKHNYKEYKYSRVGFRRDIDAILASMS